MYVNILIICLNDEISFLHHATIPGADLKKKLSSISEEQAKILCDNQEKLNEWLCGDSPVSIYAVETRSNKDRLKQILHDRGITGKELKKKLSSITEEQAKILCNNQEKLIEWLQ